MEIEEWFPAPGFEGYYEVSNLSRVRRVHATHGATPGRVLSPRVDHKGYYVAMFYRDSKHTHVKIHSLLCEIYNGPRPDGMVVRHLDGNPRNNSRSNIVWGTHVENALDSVRHGTNHWANRTHCENGHEYTPENTVSRPGGGRRCVICRRAHKEAFNVGRRERRRVRPDPKWVPRGVLADGDPRHGTAGGYTNWHCRCDACSEANREYKRAYARDHLVQRRERRRARAAQIGDNPRKVEIIPIRTPAERPAPAPKTPEPAR